MRKILMVDDDKKIRYIYIKLLTAEGFEVLEAPNADVANEILKREVIALALLDIKIPEVDGREMFDVMQLFHKDIKVIVASVYPIEEQRLIIKGAADYYDKSQGTDILLMKIKKTLGTM